ACREEATPTNVSSRAEHPHELALVIEQAGVAFRHKKRVANLGEFRSGDDCGDDGHSNCNGDDDFVVHGFLLSDIPNWQCLIRELCELPRFFNSWNSCLKARDRRPPSGGGNITFAS